MADQRTHYELLGVTSDADSDAIKRAWKVLIQVWHPDRFSGEMRDEAEQMTARINESYNVLRDTRQRDLYDSRLREAQSTPPRTTRASWSGAPRPATAFRHASPQTAFAGAGTGASHPSFHSGPVLVGAIEELKAVGRKYPRGAAALASGLVLLLGFALITAISNRPSLPSATSSSSSVVSIPASDDSMTLDAVAQEAESEAALLARREAMQERLRRQLALAEARALEDVPLEPVAPAVSEATAPKAAAPGPEGGRTIQIMPRTAPR